MKRAIIPVGAMVALTIFLVGCGPSGSHFKEVKSAVFDGSERLNKNVEISLGVIPIWMAGTVAKFIDEPGVREGREYLKHISRVDVGVYEVRDSLVDQFPVVSERVKSRMLKHGFEALVQVRDKNECVGVYLPMDEGRGIREFFVVVMEQRQVVLVRARGNFEKVAKAVYRNHAHELPNLRKMFKEEMVL